MRRNPVTTDDIDRGLGGFLPDTGCDLHAHCLTCPFTACRFDRGPGTVRTEARKAALLAHLEVGRTMEEAAVLMGLSRRTVYRLMEGKRKEHLHGRAGGGA